MDMKNRSKQIENNKRGPIAVKMRHRLHEGLFLVSIASALFLLISLATYHTSDPGWMSTGLHDKAANWGGRVGAWLADVFLSLFGIVAYLFPILILFSSWLGLRESGSPVAKESREWIYKTAGWVLAVGSSCALVSYYIHSKMALPAASGGIFGDLLGRGLGALFNVTGSTLVLTTMWLCGITFVTGLSWLGLMEWIGSGVNRLFAYLKARREAYAASRKEMKAEPKLEVPRRIQRETAEPVEPVFAEGRGEHV